MSSKLSGLIAALLLLLLLIACGPEQTTTNAPVAVGQNGWYMQGVGINQSLRIYRLSGTVLSAGQSIQNYSQSGEAMYGRYGGYAYTSGGTSGKGFIRLHITSMSWTSPVTETIDPLVTANDNVIIKTSDTKAASLVPGDTVTFLCREQAEFLEAVNGNEVPTFDKIVRELDYCRMLTPHINRPE